MFTDNNGTSGTLGAYVTGVGGSLQMTGAQMYLSDISTPKNRARTNAPTGMAFGIGAVAGPALGGYLADTLNMRAPFLVVAGIFFCFFIDSFLFFLTF